MKTIFVDLVEVKSNSLGLFFKIGFFKKMKQFFRSRGFNGCYSIEIRDIAFLHKKFKSAESKQCLKCSLSKYFFGDSFTKKMFHNSEDMVSILFENVQNNNIEYRKISYLYHFTPLENIDSIMKNGIKKMRRDYVFLSNTRDYIGFLYGKTLTMNKSTVFCILRIDAKRTCCNLCQGMFYLYIPQEV